MASCHAINGIVYKNRRNVLAPVGGVDDFCCANRCQIAVALVGEHEFVQADPFYDCTHSGNSTVGGLDCITVEEFVNKHGTVYGRNCNGISKIPSSTKDSATDLP